MKKKKSKVTKLKEKVLKKRATDQDELEGFFLSKEYEPPLSPETPEQLEAMEKTASPKVRRRYTFRFAMIGLGGLLAIMGAVMFVIYFNNLNMLVGAPSIFLLAGGIMLLKYYWGRNEDLVFEQIGATDKKFKPNSLCLYPDKILFERVEKPGGFPQQCLNDKKDYYVMKWDKITQKLIPFILPDQQYYDPSVFAQRALTLPAHQRIFARKLKAAQVVKTALLVATAAILWLLILTTATPAV